MRDQRPTPHLRIAPVVVLLLAPTFAWASDGGTSATTWLGLGAIVSAAMIAGDVAVRLKQPPVLGEVMAGVALANLPLVGFDFFPDLREIPELPFLAELGVLLLLFEIGLTSTLSEMRRAAGPAGRVALVGILAPFGLGLFVDDFLMPETSVTHHLFVAAAMAATSIGITVRVLEDLGASDRPETKILLGAAVIDDVLGLILLAVVVAFAAEEALPSVGMLARVIGSATAFLVGSILLGLFVASTIFRLAAGLRVSLVLPLASLGFCLLLAGLSVAVGLAAMIGAFAAGLLLDEADVRPFGATSTRQIEEFVHPITAFFAPVFFVYTGLSVDLSAFPPKAVLACLAFTLAAILGKVMSGWAAGSGVDRLTVGLGMIPRGEVGLIFANVGATTFIGSSPILDPLTYGSIVAMVLLTTVVAPPLLSLRLAALDRRQPDDRIT